MPDPRSEARCWLDAARELDLLYVPTRYPNGLEAGTPAQAFSQVQSSRALDLAERFIEAAAAVLAEAR
jgi:HEPN domain-containing protein